MQPDQSTLARNLRLFDCEQPVAFVTGSHANRVGRVIAETLSVAGFHVALHAHRQPQTVATEEFVLSGGIEDEENSIRWATQVMERFGRVDVVVNSAAIWESKMLEAMTAKDLDRHFQVNAIGTAMVCKHFGLAMSKQDSGGAIVNIGDWAISRPYLNFSGYFPSKAAVVSITQSMALELAIRNPRIRVNAVLPGPVMFEESIDAAKREQIEADCLLKRTGTPADVAEAVLYLASAPFVTGVCLPVDGGRTIYAGPSTDSLAHPDAH